ncbi:endonuclease/exonuclease/phosphatase family protein [bacterium]|nr:endonuclease/exonuclease/phosphatase family protein [bacterium]
MSTSEWRFKNRNWELAELGLVVRANYHPVIVAGDFNASIWLPFFKAFLNENRLQDARMGFGVIPAFPTEVPLVMIPIDRCLVSSGIKILDFHSGPNIGSDHLPLILDASIEPLQAQPLR